MTAATTTRSAYPRAVEDLLPHARDLAEKLGETPSRNMLMKTFRVGRDKANALLAHLTTTPLPPFADDAVPAAEEQVALPHAIGPEDTAEVGAGPAMLPAVAIEDEAFRLLDSHRPAEAPVVNEAAVPDEKPRRRPVTWPVLILCLPAFVAIWGGWVEMGELTGFGMVTLLPGISDFQINSAITLPIGVETYAAYALYVWLSGTVTGPALTFSKWSALGSLLLGALGQIAYHLMAAAEWTTAPWPITAAVACIPVAVLGMGAALAHLMHKTK
ncbi:ABC transporter permease [Actinoplanes hulinensis]|uniref:ABC transporter permease n=1 Tax=Actinoplanes hulinensis TaxID=1144547 RepID=A0ABS7AVC1_9ACTN|nr:ABC transporter permease [Actinoplanes hulinensis]MBW6432721.1 ABC transporter permease [Actinoplanes hulinensis]